MSALEKHKIVVDTDCGIDDAIALLLALSSKDVAEVVAITCCFGNTQIDNVCSNVKRVLTVCGEKDIPIHRGCSGPLIKRTSPETVHGGDGLGEVADKFSTGGLEESNIPAPIVLIELSKKYPKQITVVAIGPLTNLAVAHRIDPTFTENLKSIVIMGGNYKGIGNTTEVAEFNFYCDPESANIVVSESKCQIVLVPWETTMDYGIPWKTYDELIKIDTKKGNFFKTITKYSHDRGIKKGNKQLYDCDFLAFVALFYPEKVAGTFKHPIAVECDGLMTEGFTVLLANPKSVTDRQHVQIITDFDMEFLNFLRRVMLS